MKRNFFLKTSSLFLSLLYAPGAGIAKIVSKDRMKKGFKVDAGKDRFDASLTLYHGDTFSTKVSSKDTDGDLFAFESTRILAGGPALHYHYSQDEWFFILEGEFLFKVGNENFNVKAGDSVFGPRMVPHAFSKIGEGKGRMMITFQPAGKMEEHFKEISQGIYKNMSEADRIKNTREHGVEIVGPALLHEK